MKSYCNNFLYLVFSLYSISNIAIGIPAVKNGHGQEIVKRQTNNFFPNSNVPQTFQIDGRFQPSTVQQQFEQETQPALIGNDLRFASQDEEERFFASRDDLANTPPTTLNPLSFILDQHQQQLQLQGQQQQLQATPQQSTPPARPLNLNDPAVIEQQEQQQRLEEQRQFQERIANSGLRGQLRLFQRPRSQPQQAQQGAAADGVAVAQFTNQPIISGSQQPTVASLQTAESLLPSAPGPEPEDNNANVVQDLTQFPIEANSPVSQDQFQGLPTVDSRLNPQFSDGVPVPASSAPEGLVPIDPNFDRVAVTQSQFSDQSVAATPESQQAGNPVRPQPVPQHFHNYPAPPQPHHSYYFTNPAQ